MSIPFSPDIARLCSRGANLVDEDPSWRGEFVGVYRRLQEACSGTVV